jgi:hypothetical protein
MNRICMTLVFFSCLLYSAERGLPMVHLVLTRASSNLETFCSICSCTWCVCSVPGCPGALNFSKNLASPASASSPLSCDDCKVGIAIDGTHSWQDRLNILSTRLIDAQGADPEVAVSESLHQFRRISQRSWEFINLNRPCHAGAICLRLWYGIARHSSAPNVRKCHVRRCSSSWAYNVSQGNIK